MPIKEENRRPVSSIIGLAANGLPGPVPQPEVENGLLENVPIIGEHLDFFDSNSVFHGYSEYQTFFLHSFVSLLRIQDWIMEISEIAK